MVALATTAIAARQACRVVGQLGAAAGSEEEACSSRAGLGRRRAAGSAGAVASWVVVAGWMQGRGGRKVGSVGGTEVIGGKVVCSPISKILADVGFGVQVESKSS